MIIIELLPVGNVPGKPLEAVCAGIKDVFGETIRECRIATKLPIPREAYSEERDQYLASFFVELAADHQDPEVNCVLAVTDRDLYAPDLNFVFGQAQMLGVAATISIHRLNPSFYGEKNPSLLETRTIKEAVHEIGHTRGLKHCSDPKCVMCFSNSIFDVDKKTKYFCRRCQEALE